MKKIQTQIPDTGNNSEICKVLEELSIEEITHVTQYTQEFWNLTEDEQEKLTYEQEAMYVKYPELEDKFQTENRTKKGNHFKVCQNPNCQRLKNVWLGETTLKEFVKEEVQN